MRPELFGASGKRLRRAFPAVQDSGFKRSRQIRRAREDRDPAIAMASALALLYRLPLAAAGQSRPARDRKPIRMWRISRRWPRRCAATSTRCMPSSTSAEVGPAEARGRATSPGSSPEHPHRGAGGRRSSPAASPTCRGSILTPDLCAHWDGLGRLLHARARPKSEAPTEDRLRGVVAALLRPAIFNPGPAPR